MKRTITPIHEQVMVITGASSGIGLATAYAAAEQGQNWCWWPAVKKH